MGENLIPVTVLDTPSEVLQVKCLLSSLRIPRIGEGVPVSRVDGVRVQTKGLETQDTRREGVTSDCLTVCRSTVGTGPRSIVCLVLTDRPDARTTSTQIVSSLFSSLDGPAVQSGASLF